MSTTIIDIIITFWQETFWDTETKRVPWKWIQVLHITWPVKLMMIWAPVFSNHILTVVIIAMIIIQIVILFIQDAFFSNN